MAKDLRFIYKAATEEEGAAALESFRKNGTNAIPMSLSPGRRTGVRYQPFLSIPRRSARWSIRQIPLRACTGRSKKWQRTNLASRTSRLWSNSSTWLWSRPQENGQCDTGTGPWYTHNWWSFLKIVWGNMFKWEKRVYTENPTLPQIIRELLQLGVNDLYSKSFG